MPACIERVTVNVDGSVSLQLTYWVDHKLTTRASRLAIGGAHFGHYPAKALTTVASAVCSQLIDRGTSSDGQILALPLMRLTLLQGLSRVSLPPQTPRALGRNALATQLPCCLSCEPASLGRLPPRPPPLPPTPCLPGRPRTDAPRLFSISS